MKIQEATDFIKAQITIMNYTIDKKDVYMNTFKEALTVVSDYVIQNERKKAFEFINKLKTGV